MNSEKAVKNKKAPNAMKTLGVTAFRRTVWVPIIWSVIMVVLTVMMFDSYSYRYYNTVNPFNFEDVVQELNEIMPMYIISIIFSALFGAMQFSFLTRVNSVGFVHSLPVTRNGIFVSYYLSGVVSVLIPQIVLALSVLMIPWKYRFIFALFVLAVGVLYSVGVYSFAVMMSMFSAKTIGCVLFAAIGLAVPYLVENFIHIIMRASLYGYFYEGDYWIVENVYLIPELVMSLKGLIYVAAIVIFTFCAWLLYKRNHSELAGDLIAYPGIRGVATVICGILTGVTGYLIFDGSLILFALFGAICAVLINFAVRKRFEFKSSILFAGIMIGITLVIFTVFSMDITGFEKRIPDIDDIQSAKVYDNYRRNDYVGYTDDNIMLYKNGNASEIRNRKSLETVTEFHRELLDNKDYHNYRSYETMIYTSTSPYYINSYDPTSYGNIIIEYKLKNGRTLVRKYKAYHGRNREALLKIAALPETKVYDHPIVRNDIRLTYARLETPAGVVSLTAREAEQVRKALSEDIINAPASTERGLNDFRSISVTRMYFDYEFTELYDEAGKKITDKETLGMFDYNNEEVLYPHYTRTISLLRSMGYGKYIDFENLPDDMTVTVEKHVAENAAGIDPDKYREMGEEYMKLSTDVYLGQKSNDKELIKNILKYAFSVSSTNCEEMYDTAYRISVDCKNDISQDSDISFFIYGEVDFIETWLATTNQEKVSDSSYDGVPYMVNKHPMTESVEIYEKSIW